MYGAGVTTVLGAAVMIFQALEFAARAHHGHYRKGSKTPYILHPLAAAKILIDLGCEGDVVVAAILHDCIEDTPTTQEEITLHFGPKVAALVVAASEPDKSDTWENRKKHTIEGVDYLSRDAVLLVLADKLDNIRAIRQDLERRGEYVWKRFRRPREQQKWYYESLAAAFATACLDDTAKALLALYQEEVRQVFGEFGR